MTVEPSVIGVANTPILGVLLAGGVSRRMGGGDKCLLKLGGKTLLHHAIDRLTPQVKQLILSANGDPSRFAEFGLPVVADTPPADGNIEPQQGPLAGVLAAMDWAAEHVPDCPMIATAPTDAPFLPINLVSKMTTALAARQAELACAIAGGRSQPVIGLWPVKFRHDLRDRHGFRRPKGRSLDQPPRARRSRI